MILFAFVLGVLVGHYVIEDVKTFILFRRNKKELHND